MLERVLFFFSFLLAATLGATEAIAPLPLVPDYMKTKAELGKKLFSDPILSRDGTISCSSCHDLQNGGDDGREVSVGINGAQGNINAPTVYNARYNFRQFWDGRAKDLAEQAAGPIENPIEMNNTFENLIETLEQTPYKTTFESLYDDGITKANIIDAIAEFEKALITPNAPFDRYLRGDKEAITQDQAEGYALFKAKGCISCHHGINIGSNLYSKFGVAEDANSAHFGRFNVTKQERDKFYFKVPTLRNIEHTAPYFHDGGAQTLEDAVKVMASYQLGRHLDDDEIRKIVAFLRALSGEIPPEAKR